MKLHEIARQARALGIVMGENSGNRERQEKLLALILRYDALCRGAIEKGAPVMKLFDIPAREKIGRAKSVPADQYETVYAQLRADMERQIADIAAKGGDEE